MIAVTSENFHKILKDIDKRVESLDEKTAYKVMFVSEEIITNIIRHADFGEKIPDIGFDMKLNSGASLVFRDNAKKFDILAHQDPEIISDVKSRNLGGLGIYLTKKYAKNINYSYKDGYNILKVEI